MLPGNILFPSESNNGRVTEVKNITLGMKLLLYKYDVAHSCLAANNSSLNV